MSERIGVAAFSREYLIYCNNNGCKKKGQLLELFDDSGCNWIFRCSGCNNTIAFGENSFAMNTIEKKVIIDFPYFYWEWIKHVIHYKYYEDRQMPENKNR